MANFEKFFKSLDFLGNRIKNVKVDQPTNDEHVVPKSYVDLRTIYNTLKSSLYVNPFKLSWVKEPHNKQLNEVIDDILFPRVNPEYFNPFFKSFKFTKEESSIIFISVTNNGFKIAYDINTGDRFLNQAPKVVITDDMDNVTNIVMSNSNLKNEEIFNINWSNIQKIEFIAVFNPTTIVKQDTYGDDFVPEEFETIYELKYDLLELITETTLISPKLLYRKIYLTDNIDNIIEDTIQYTEASELITNVDYFSFHKQLTVFEGLDNQFLMIIPKIVFEKHLLIVSGDNVPLSIFEDKISILIDNIDSYLVKIDLGFYTEVTILPIEFRKNLGSVVSQNIVGEPIPLLAINVLYENGNLTNVQEALDSLLYVSPIIKTFINSVNIVQKGFEVTEITFDWTLNKIMTTSIINNNIGNVLNLLTKTVTGLSIEENKTFILTVSDGVNTINKSTTVFFQNKLYWGFSSNGNLSTFDISTLQNSELVGSRLFTKDINGGGEYIYMCYPANLGAAVYIVNGFNFTAIESLTKSFTNELGFTENYIINKIMDKQNGTLTIQQK